MKKENVSKKPPPKSSNARKLKPENTINISRYWDLAAMAFITLLGFIIYSNSFTCSFHFDDIPNIVKNELIFHLGDVKAWWNYSPNRPVSMFTFALNYHFNHLDVRYYHLVNLVIHLVNAGLVWALTMLIFSSPVMKDDPAARDKKMLAFITGLLFLSHPLATQSVTYIIQRMTSLVTLFYLLSVVLYMKARLEDKSNTSKYLLFVFSMISALLAMLTKEIALTLPFAILLTEFFFFQTGRISINFRDYRVILLLAAFLALALILPLKNSLTLFHSLPPNLRLGHTFTITPLNYFLTQAGVIVTYIRLFILPVNQNLDYDYPLSHSFFETGTLLSFILLIFLVVLSIFLFRRSRIISFGILWFFLTLSIQSSFIPREDLIVEHRTYLPSPGFFLVLSSLVYALLWKKHKYFAITLFCFIIGSNSVLTYERNKVWKNDLTLWNDVVLKSPQKPRALVGRGVAYGTAGQWGNAIADYAAAIQLNPGYADAYYNRGIAYAALHEREAAIADFSKAIGFHPDFPQAYYNRGIVYGDQKMWKESIRDYSEAIMLDPKYASAYCNLGTALGNQGQWDRAIDSYSKAIGLNPRYAAAYYSRGFAYATTGEWSRAIDDFTRTLEIDPDYPDAASNRAYAISKLQEMTR